VESNYGPWTVCRAFLNLFGFVILGLAWMWQVHHNATSHRDSLNTPSAYSRNIQQQYANFNGWWFEGKLPKDVTVTWGSAEGYMAITKGDDDRALSIEINPKYGVSEKQIAALEFHEMCHVAIWNEDSRSHGKKWQACMLRLAEQGAFENVW
jgi:hypothetical protein